MSHQSFPGYLIPNFVILMNNTKVWFELEPKRQMQVWFEWESHFTRDQERVNTDLVCTRVKMMITGAVNRLPPFWGVYPFTWGHHQCIIDLKVYNMTRNTLKLACDLWDTKLQLLFIFALNNQTTELWFTDTFYIIELCNMHFLIIGFYRFLLST